MARTDANVSLPRPLHGRGIVVTRPAAQSERLASLVTAAGGTAIVFPLIEIRALRDDAAARRLARAAEYDIAVFVSANAVQHGLALLPEGLAWPASLPAAAVGEGTARALRSRGITNVLLPADRYDSEGLLALPEMNDVAGRRILIVRGAGGRELLGETLAARGASVEYAECYERLPPSGGAEALLAAWRERAVHAITITSSEALRNLYALLPEEGRTLLQATPLFVTHQRMRDLAVALGIDDVVIAAPGDEGLCAALVHYFGSRA